MATEKVLKALAVTAELTGTLLSRAAAAVFAQDLARYPEEQVLGALDRCRKELHGRMTPGDVIARLDDGRPGPEEAWAMLPKDELSSAVWTDEMREAFGVALPMIEEDDLIAARMAFLERYRALLLKARESGTAVRWSPTLGFDKSGREAAIVEAYERGRLTAEHAAILLPYHRDGGMPERMAAALARVQQKLLSSLARAT